MDTRQHNSPARNLRIVFACLFLVGGMGGLAYASVPLYRIFCQVTGYGGTTQRAQNVEGVPVLEREVTVRFDANKAPGLDWNFKPVQRSVVMKLGEVNQISYVAENTGSRTVTGTATFNVTPQAAGAYFNKIECFCFTETTLRPGEKLDMPVVFFVDPEMIDYEETRNIRTLTLSYTFFPVDDPQEPLAANTTIVEPAASGG